MAVTSDRIETFLETRDLKFYRRMDDDNVCSWLLFFGSQSIVTIGLLEDGECLLFRSTGILNLDEYPSEHRATVFQYLMARNDKLMVGHYSGTSNVVFEMTLPIEDGDVSDDQLGRILAVVSSEVSRHGAAIRAIARGEAPPESADDSESTDSIQWPELDDDAIDELMNRLCHDDEDERAE